MAPVNVFYGLLIKNLLRLVVQAFEAQLKFPYFILRTTFPALLRVANGKEKVILKNNEMLERIFISNLFSYDRKLYVSVRST